MSAVSFPVRPPKGRRPYRVTDSFNRTGYVKTSANPRGEHRGVDINRGSFTPGPSSVRDWIIQLPEYARLVAKGYDSAAGYWMEWEVLTGPWLHRYMRFFHMNRPCSFALGTKKNRKYAVGRVGNTGHSTNSHLHFELGKHRWSAARDPRWNPTEAFRNSIRDGDW